MTFLFHPQGLGCFIACSITTRKDVMQEVTQEVTRESRRLALSVCAAVATSALGALGSILSSHQPQLHFLLPSLAILTGTASLLLLGGGVNAKVSPLTEPPPPGNHLPKRLRYQSSRNPRGNPLSSFTHVTALHCWLPANTCLHLAMQQVERLRAIKAYHQNWGSYKKGVAH